MKKILLVEDDPFILDIYASQFKREGYGVDVATDGQMALERVKHSCPDLIVLDIELPKLNGWQVLEALRKDPTTKQVKVIVVSNNNETDCTQNIINLGVLKYFLKIEHTATEIIAYVRSVLK